MNHDVIKEMKLEDKIKLCSGLDFWHTKAMDKYNIESIMMADGPHGLRKQEVANDMLGINRSVEATCFPTAAISACSFDVDLIGEMSNAIALEAKANNVNVVLGPGINIKRNPLCGRNFEYFSEDPYLSGKLGASYIRNVEKEGIGTSLKHFALNSQELKRFSSSSVVDERTMREIYLAPFEMAVKEGKPSTVMCAYNKINGTHCSDNKMLLTDILRNEWGFEGLVVSDWGGMNNRMKAFEAGCDLCMPGRSDFMEKEAYKAVMNNELDEKYIDASVERVLDLVKKTKISEQISVDMNEHDELACKVAKESAVLLKNEASILPLDENEDVAFIGYMAQELRYQGSGSSHINPWKLTNVVDVFKGKYACGCDVNGETNDTLLAEAKALASKSKYVVVVAGLTDIYESEGFERDNMKLPAGHNRLIEEVSAVNHNTIVVLLSGSAVELPWVNQVKSILYMGLSGQAGGKAICDLVFGRANPCGKLAETWPVQYDDCISSSYYAKTKNAYYREGVYVGYRYYQSAAKPVRYAFGHGLSYTSFEYSNLSVEGDIVACDITNTGDRVGKEIAQLYIEPLTENEYRPKLELKGFLKVELAPNETKRVTFKLDEYAFAIFQNGWIIPSGEYRIHVGKASDNLLLSTTVYKEGNEAVKKVTSKWYYDLEGVPTQTDLEELLGHKIVEKPLVKGEFTMENTVLEMSEHSLLMKGVYKVVEMVIASGFDGKKDMSNPAYKMMLTSAVDASMNGMKINGGIKPYLLEGLVEMANGHFFKGIFKMLG